MVQNINLSLMTWCVDTNFLICRGLFKNRTESNERLSSLCVTKPHLLWVVFTNGWMEHCGKWWSLTKLKMDVKIIF